MSTDGRHQFHASELPPKSTPAGGIFGIDDVKINRLVDEARDVVALTRIGVRNLIQRGIIIEPTILGITFSVTIRIPEPDEETT